MGFYKRFHYVWCRDIRRSVLREHLREMPRDWYYIGESWGGLIGAILGWVLKPFVFVTWPFRTFAWAIWASLVRPLAVDEVMRRQPLSKLKKEKE